MKFTTTYQNSINKNKRLKLKTLVWYDTKNLNSSVKIFYKYLNDLYEKTQLIYLKEYISWILWLHPNIQVNYMFTMKHGWGNFFFKAPFILACFSLIFNLLANFLGGWDIFKFIVIVIIFYALIWGKIQGWWIYYTPSGRRQYNLESSAKKQKIQKYIIQAVLKKKIRIVRNQEQSFFKERSLKFVRQRWALEKTNFQPYVYDINCTYKKLFDVNRYIIKHHKSYYRHDKVLDPLARTLANQEIFINILLSGNLLELMVNEFKIKKYIMGNGYLEIKKLYAKDHVYDHKNNTILILACYALCWVSNDKGRCEPVLALGPWAVEKQEKKPWYKILDLVVNKEAFKAGYRINYILDSMWISKSRTNPLGSYDIVYNKPREIKDVTTKRYKSAPRQVVLDAVARSKLPIYKKARAWIRHEKMMFTSRFSNPRANFKQISDYKFGKKWDRQNPRLGRIFNWLETEGRWYYWKYRFFLNLKYSFFMWRRCKLYPFLYWCVIVFIASINYVLYQILIKCWFMICRELWKSVKLILVGSKIIFNNCLKLVKEQKEKFNWKLWNKDKYLFGETEMGFSWYFLHERLLNRVRRFVRKKLWYEKQSDEHMLELRHDIVVGHIERVIKENWNIIYDNDLAYTVRSMAGRPFCKNAREKNLVDLLDILEYRLVAEQCFDAKIYCDNIPDILMYLCANMDTYVLQEKNYVKEKMYINDLLQFFCVFPMVSKLETLSLKDLTKIESKVILKDYIVDKNYHYLEKLQDNVTLLSNISRSYIKEDLIFCLSKQILQNEIIKKPYSFKKYKRGKIKLKNQNIKLNKINNMSWNELKLYL